MSHSTDDEPHEEHEEHVNHEAWVIPYADLLTLLMAMFIALFAMSRVDSDKFKELAIGLNKAFSGSKLDTGVFAEDSGTGVAPGLGGESEGARVTVSPAAAQGDSMLSRLLSQQAQQRMSCSP